MTRSLSVALLVFLLPAGARAALPAPLLVSLPPAGPRPPAPPVPRPMPRESARSMLTAFAAGDMTTAARDFAPVVRKILPGAVMRLLWADQIKRNGAFHSI